MKLSGLRCRPSFDAIPEISHEELVKHAAIWLRYDSQTHTIVITERSGSGSETPDAIGVSAGGWSTLIECKTSRADFLADKKKHFRRHAARGMGHRRYFMAPVGLLKPEELPENWGLIEIYEKTDSGRRRRHVTKTATHFPEIHERAQTGMLVSVLRRLEIACTVFVRQAEPRTNRGERKECKESDK